MGLFDFFKRTHRSHTDRQYGFEYFNKAFNWHKKTPDLDVTVEFPLKVRIVGSRDKFTWDKAKLKENGIVGYASQPPPLIEILGKRVNGQIICNQSSIGHELVHILNFLDLSIANPDKLKKLF